MTFLKTANSKPNCKQQTVAASIFAHITAGGRGSKFFQFYAVLQNNRLAHPFWKILDRGRSRIPRRRGHHPPGMGRQHTNLPDMPQNCLRSRTFWSVEGGAHLDPPLLDPPL